MNNLKLYTVELDLLRKFNSVESKVQFSENANYENKPFIGVLFKIDETDYLVPLSSPKRKHHSLNNNLDFHKVFSENGKLIAVMNFNNMIPVHQSLIKPIILADLYKSENPEDYKYASLLKEELDFINSKENKIKILSKAKNIYQGFIKNTLHDSLKVRCNDFSKLEVVLKEYLLEQIIIQEAVEENTIVEEDEISLEQ